jgi:transposase
VVSRISAQTVRRILKHHHLKPWQHHLWLSPKAPRDAAFRQAVQNICNLYTRRIQEHEMVVCLDEKTSLQPRTRVTKTTSACPHRPIRVEHEYIRQGAVHLFGALDTRTGRVFGQCYRRKRQVELIQFLSALEQQIPQKITKIHVVADNVSTHKGKVLKRWLKSHPRFEFHFPPVHCSWINQIEQWFSILQRKRLAYSDFQSVEDLIQKILAFIDQYNQRAHPFNWTSKSVAKIMAYVECASLQPSASLMPDPGSLRQMFS